MLNTGPASGRCLRVFSKLSTPWNTLLTFSPKLNQCKKFSARLNLVCPCFNFQRFRSHNRSKICWRNFDRDVKPDEVICFLWQNWSSLIRATAVNSNFIKQEILLFWNTSSSIAVFTTFTWPFAQVKLRDYWTLGLIATYHMQGSCRLRPNQLWTILFWSVYRFPT